MYPSMAVKVGTLDSGLVITDVPYVDGLAEVAEIALQVFFLAEDAQVQTGFVDCFDFL